ncbi:prepilin-type N-terminal cleavage/methylation domain-containing protein [Chamaesiphon sp. OTE_75_metabat_556]|uniref:pilus assembly FimT family protein n=1 Tax=Chamaesiphon sp. OTE_75_metabat_556 TaxID=2964692 RepID=UPI00286C325E|nr:prepilin-type N-terminal cleavage/methylation domain-containing protein [Chamaesiphon sp. OTE_75_metabat_556]
MAIRPPKYNSQGFTLVETLASLIVIGFIMGMAAPSLLSLNKPLRDGSLQFQAHLNLIRSKAISSNRAYRLKPKYPTAALVLSAHPNRAYPQSANNFVVESARNCQVTTSGTNPSDPTGRSDGWQIASQLDLDLPEAIGVSSDTADVPQVGVPATTPGLSLTITPANGSTPTTVVAESHLNWSICYDNRGVAFQPVSLTLKDFQANNKAQFSFVEVIGVGSVEIRTKDKNRGFLNTSANNPVF